MNQKNLSIINKKVIAYGSFIKLNYSKNKFFKIIKKTKIGINKNKIYFN